MSQNQIAWYFLVLEAQSQEDPAVNLRVALWVYFLILLLFLDLSLCEVWWEAEHLSLAQLDGWFWKHWPLCAAPALEAIGGMLTLVC